MRHEIALSVAIATSWVRGASLHGMAFNAASYPPDRGVWPEVQALFLTEHQDLPGTDRRNPKLVRTCWPALGPLCVKGVGDRRRSTTRCACRATASLASTEVRPSHPTGTAGAMTSPGRNQPFLPCSRANWLDFFGAEGGTISATGTPNRVTRRGFLVLPTRSRVARQVALNLEIAISSISAAFHPNVPWSKTMV